MREWGRASICWFTFQSIEMLWNMAIFFLKNRYGRHRKWKWKQPGVFKSAEHWLLLLKRQTKMLRIEKTQLRESCMEFWSWMQGIKLFSLNTIQEKYRVLLNKFEEDDWHLQFRLCSKENLWFHQKCSWENKRPRDL